MDEIQLERMAAVRRRVLSLLEQYLQGAALEGLMVPDIGQVREDRQDELRLREDLLMDLVDHLYFLADLEDVFGVPMHVRSSAKLNTIGDAVRMAFAANPLFFWDEPKEDE